MRCVGMQFCVIPCDLMVHTGQLGPVSRRAVELIHFRTKKGPILEYVCLPKTAFPPDTFAMCRPPPTPSAPLLQVSLSFSHFLFPYSWYNGILGRLFPLHPARANAGGTMHA